MNDAKKLVFHIITSKVFWVGAPMVMSEIVKRGHYLSSFDEKRLPVMKDLLACDVLIDMSTITQSQFYTRLETAAEKLGKRSPLFVDPPAAIKNSLDKRKTHILFPDLIPESYVLTGKGNAAKISAFKDDDFVVIKTPTGWWGEGVRRYKPRQALEKFSARKGLIVQKYVHPTNGIGRIVTIQNGNDFEIACSYTRIPTSWKTSLRTAYKCTRVPVDPSLKAFAKTVSKRSGLYLNGIDYIRKDGRYYLLEVNAVPAMKEPLEHFGIDIPEKLLTHIERNAHSRTMS